MKTAFQKLSVVILLILLYVSSGLAVELKTQENSLGKVQAGFSSKNLFLSPNGRHMAYIVPSGKGKAVVIIDGQKSEEYDDAGSFTVSPDSNRYSYVFLSDGKWHVNVDKIIEGRYEQIGANTLQFSPDSKRLCYVVLEPSNKRQYVVVDGVEQQKYAEIFEGYPVFSENSKTIAYGAKKGNKVVAVINGKEGEEFDAIAGIVVSPDGNYWAYAGKKDGKWYRVLNGYKSRSGYDGIVEDSIVFSGDSRRLAYAAGRNGECFLVVDDKEGTPCDVIDKGSVIFSLDSQRWAYRSVKGGKQCYVVDGRANKLYESVVRDSFSFSSDSKHFAYIAIDQKKSIVVLDGEEVQKYDSVFPLVFNRRKHTLAISGNQDGNWFVVDGGKRGKTYEMTDAPVISDDGEHIAYRVKSSKKQMVVCDSREGKKYDNINTGSFTFTSANNHLLYNAREGNKGYVVVDTAESNSYDYILQNGEFFFTSEDTFNFIAIRDREFFVVDIKILKN